MHPATVAARDAFLIKSHADRELGHVLGLIDSIRFISDDEAADHYKRIADGLKQVAVRYDSLSEAAGDR